MEIDNESVWWSPRLISSTLVAIANILVITYEWVLIFITWLLQISIKQWLVTLNDICNFEEACPIFGTLRDKL